MSAVRPVAVYALKVPTGGVLIPAVPQAAASFRVSMAAIDPDETPELEDGIDPSKPRATLKLIRPPPGMNIEESDEEEDWEDDDEEDSDEEESNGGPSDKEKARKLKEAAALKEMEEDEDEDDDEEEEDDDDDDEDFDLKAAISKLVKGKGPATDDDDEDDEDDESLDVDEAVICTLDPEKHYQQALDITVAEGEPIFFKVTGTHSVYLTGNYVMPVDDHDHDHDHSDEEDEDDYDLSPDENELDMDDIMDEDEEDDELDGLENPRVTEVESEEEAPKLVEAKGQKKADKGKKRAAEEASLEDLMAKDKKAQPEEGLSKKQQKKLKKNSGEAAEVEQKKEAKEAKEAKDAKEGKEAKEGKKVQFAKNLEQGPTPSSQDKKSETTGTLGVKNVNGVTIDDKKLGKGPVAKSGNNVAMRYIGKLEDGKVFDSNKKGKPFSFKLGKGEVIKGWDIGVAGMAVGAERRISIPPHLAYGKKALPGIPGNSKLVFDVKLLEIK